MIEDPKNRRPFIYYYIIVLVIMTALNFLVVPFIKEGQIKQVDYGTFMTMTEKGEISKVDIQTNQILFTGKNDNVIYKTGLMNDPGLTDRLHNAGVQFSSEIIRKESPLLSAIVSWVLPLAIFYFLWNRISKRMFDRNSANSLMFGGMGRSGAKVYVKSSEGIKFSDVAGEDEAKENLTEIVDYLHDPSKYKDIGASMPKGILLVGPPGTGKTLLAKAVAGEANVPFFSLSGSDFVEMFVGVGASRVRDLFKQAHSMAPCIIFIDEIDAIGKSRDSKYGGGNDEREQTLNQLLAEMDGFDAKSKGVVILAATNRPDVLDKALLRPGRFDRRVIVDRPDLKGRIAILKVHSKDVLMDDTVDLDAIAMATAGAVGSDLANMINEAAIMAVKAGRKSVGQADLFEAVEVVIAGKEKKDRILGKEEKRIVAFHEVGHALITASMKNADPVQKITIVPRTMGSLGYTMQLPKEEKFLQSKEELETDIVTFLGGRAAEDVVFNSVTTGASNDIERATAILRSMITQYGMSDKFGMVGLESIENRYLDGRAVLNCADETAARIDEEVARRMKEYYDRAVNIIKENRDALEKIAEYLIEKETITGKEFIKMYRDIKGLPEPEDEKADKAEANKTGDNKADVAVTEEIKTENVVTENPVKDESTDKVVENTTENAGDTEK